MKRPSTPAAGTAQTSFTESLDISNWNVLESAAREAGLDAAEMHREVESGRYSADVAARVRDAYRIGISGVPTYVINNRYALVGAQPYEAFQHALRQILGGMEDQTPDEQG